MVINVNIYPQPFNPHPHPQKIDTIMVIMYIDLNNTGCLCCCDTDLDPVYIPYPTTHKCIIKYFRSNKVNVNNKYHKLHIPTE